MCCLNTKHLLLSTCWVSCPISTPASDTSTVYRYTYLSVSWSHIVFSFLYIVKDSFLLTHALFDSATIRESVDSLCRDGGKRPRMSNPRMSNPRMCNPKMSNAKMSTRVLISTVPGESTWNVINAIMLFCISSWLLGLVGSWYSVSLGTIQRGLYVLS